VGIRRRKVEKRKKEAEGEEAEAGTGADKKRRMVNRW
jgi:hypothetical protein